MMSQQADHSPGRQHLLSLAMIVKDAGSDLARCLGSVAGFVDEIVIVDTGSTDDTLAIAAAHGARVVQHAWQDDFAAARNAGLAVCTGRWILVLDADEVIAPQDGPRLRAWVEQTEAARRDLAAVFVTRNYQPLRAGLRNWRCLPATDPHALPEGPPATGYVPTRKVRLFPSRPQVRFTGCLHELVEESLLADGCELVELDVPIHHFGMLEPDPEKRRRYLELALRKTENEPLDAQAWSELADCWQGIGDPLRALDAIDQALKLQPENPAYRLRAGLLLEQQECWREARLHLDAVINTPGATDDVLAEALHARAVVALKDDCLDEVGNDLALALRLSPEQGVFWNTLGCWHLLNQRGEEARGALEKAASMLPGHADPPLNLGILYQAADHRDSSAVAQRPKAFDKKSFSTES